MMMRRRRRRIKRGFTDKVWLANFIIVNIIVVSIIVLTALSGILGITDMSALAEVPKWAYGELSVFSAMVVAKNGGENISEKFKKNDDIEFL